MAAICEPQRRPRVLQLSYACSPVRGSEAGVGWQRALQAAKHFDTWVICEEHEFADEIRDYLDAEGDIPGLHFVFVPIDQREWSWGQIHDWVWYAVLRRWHRQAFRVARQLHEQLHFDLVHQVTFCGFREPGYLWKLDAPFVWGPIGGTQNYPWRFLAAAGVRGALHETCRSIVNNLQLRLGGRVRRATRKAAAIVAATSTSQRDFARAHGVAPLVLPDVGLVHVDACPRKREVHAGPLRILWSGLLTHRKALHLLIRALARLPNDVPYELRILGEGPMRASWERLARQTGVAAHAVWLGRLPHGEAMRQYAWADVFVFSSLRDTTGMVVVEALGAGLPVIGLDHQGVHDVLTDDCGVKIPVTTPREVIVRLSEAIARLARDDAERERLGRGALRRAGEYLWSRQEPAMIELYRRVLGGRRSICRQEGALPDEEDAGRCPESPAIAAMDVGSHPTHL
jgi:glycosyltransferase involved in cell wall biosynthesis